MHVVPSWMPFEVFAEHRALCVQDQDAAHQLWLVGHKILLMVHMVWRTALHKAVPSMFSGPLMASMVQGSLPYRAVTSAMYKDCVVFAAVVLSLTALWLHTFR